MLLETSITHRLEDYEPCLLYRNQLELIPHAKLFIERFLLSENTTSESILCMQYEESMHHAVGRIACNIGSWYRGSEVEENYSWAILLESSHYTKEQLSLMNTNEFNALLEVIFVMPQQAIDDIFEYHMYRRAQLTYSLYNNVVAFQNEQYRISDHWNMKVRKKDGRTKISARTTDGLSRVEHFQLGKRMGNKWEIIMDYGKSVTRTQQEQIDVVKEIQQSNLFENNPEILTFMRDFADAFN